MASLSPGTDHDPPGGIDGVAPDGTPVHVDLTTGRHALWFLTSTCRPCRTVWPRLGRGDVAVTPSPSTESRRKVAAITPHGVSVVMSSDAWFAFRCGPAPWKVVLVDGAVVENGPAGSGEVDAEGVDSRHDR